MLQAISFVHRRVATRSTVHVRFLRTTPPAHKTVAEKASEVAHKMNMSVGKGLASALEKGEEAAESTKEVIGAKTEAAKKTADESANVAKQQANEMAAGAKQTKHDVQNQLRK